MNTVRILKIKSELELLDTRMSETMSNTEDEMLIYEEVEELEMELDLLTDQVR